MASCANILCLIKMRVSGACSSHNIVSMLRSLGVLIGQVPLIDVSSRSQHYTLHRPRSSPLLSLGNPESGDDHQVTILKQVSRPRRTGVIWSVLFQRPFHSRSRRGLNRSLRSSGWDFTARFNRNFVELDMAYYSKNKRASEVNVATVYITRAYRP